MSITRALLINPPSGLYRRDDRCQSKVEDQTVAVVFPPLELAYMAAMLEQKGIICQIQDYPVICAADNWDIFRADLTQFIPDMVVINTTTPTLVNDLKTAKLVKKYNQSILTVARGEYFTVYDEQVLVDYPEVDVLIRGEPELTIAELITTSDFSNVLGITYRSKIQNLDSAIRNLPAEALAQAGPKSEIRNPQSAIIRNPERPVLDNLDLLPFPARHLLDNSLYRSPENNQMITVIQTSRGCPARCIFCSAPLVAGHAVRQRTPENVVAEVQECVNKHGIRNFLFNADTFTWNESWVIELCQNLVSLNLDIRWGANSRVDTVTPEMLKWMKRAGCWVVGFGIESGNQDILNKMKKGITLDTIRAAIKMTKQAGLKTHAFYVFGLPWETEETIKDTIGFAKEVDTDFFDFNIAYPLPGTELYETVQQKNLFVISDNETASYAIPAVRSHTLSPEQLDKYRKSALWQLYLRPTYIFRTLFTAGSPKIVLNYLRFAFRRALNLLK